MTSHLDSVQLGIRNRTREALGAKVSFHLIAPMIEAWFFADPEALLRAGVPAETEVYFEDSTDPEAFVTADGAYLAATESTCPAFVALAPGRKKKLRPKWIGSLQRERHPKGYLQWLCRAPAERSCTNYSETKTGGVALAEIHWEVLLNRPSEQFRFLRALVENLEDGLGCCPTVPVGEGASLLTARSAVPQHAVLRNL